MPMLQQDVERIVTLKLTRHDSNRDTGQRLKHEMRHFHQRASDWFNYCVAHAALLQPSVDAFDQALEIENQRHRLTLATLLGAAFVALQRRPPTEHEAAGWAKRYAGVTQDHVQAAGDRNDAMEALNHLLYWKPIGEQRMLAHHIAMGLIVAANPALGEPINGGDEGKDKWLKREYRRSRTVLYNHAIEVKMEGHQGYVYVMNQAPAINKIFERTPWQGGWKQAIARAPGVRSLDNARYFAGHNRTARGVAIPGELIPEAELGEAFDDDGESSGPLPGSPPF
jgi:hypothetical protein